MRCGICNGEMEERTVTYTGNIEQVTVAIRQVPAHVCTECGNIWYSGTISAQLEKRVSGFASTTRRGKVSIIF